MKHEIANQMRWAGSIALAKHRLYGESNGELIVQSPEENNDLIPAVRAEK